MARKKRDCAGQELLTMAAPEPQASAAYKAHSHRPKREKPRKDPQCVDIWPYLVLMLHPDGTAGAEAPKGSANWEGIEQSARDRLAKLRRDAELIEQWLAAPRRTEVELRC